jgi:hypothetical protein
VSREPDPEPLDRPAAPVLYRPAPLMPEWQSQQELSFRNPRRRSLCHLRLNRSYRKILPSSISSLCYSRVSSTRRLRARPSSVSLVSIGCEAPKPFVDRRSGAMW